MRTAGKAATAFETLEARRRAWPLYVDALRHMRPRQLVHRPRRLLPPRLLALGLDRSSTPAFSPVAVHLGLEAAPQSGPSVPPHEERTFFAVGRRRTFADDGSHAKPGFWRDGADGVLFLFHLHGFTPLASYAAGRRTSAGDRFWAGVLQSWLASEDRPRRPAWHPFPTSVRIVAWASALSTIDTWPDGLRARLVESLWRQARYLRRTVEHDIGGNHVMKNAKALAVAGACFPESALLERGLHTLEREAARQILPDGGHEERSTSYHREVAHDLAELSELLECMGGRPAWLRSVRSRMESWQAHLAGPDGRLPLLNDAWEGPPLPLLEDPPPALQLGSSGYTVLRDPETQTQVLFDAGPISPPHLPPHAHADALSFVLWADGSPVIVDPGAYAYTGPERRRFRSTAAHNTVEVAGQDQCELWGDFRAAFPPRVRSLPIRRGEGVLIARGSHDGYRRLSDPVVHERTLVLVVGEGLIVVDLLHASSPQPVCSFLHLAPGVQCERVEEVGPFTLNVLGHSAALRRTQGEYAPFLGTRVGAPVIEQGRLADPETPFGWSLLRGEGKVETLERDRLVVAPGDRHRLEIPLYWD
ncbi:MAG: heparinase II/III family protein [Actinomycetota bacterium]|nr:heparinase II/III family protein [Actinomycetota bacterium]